WDNRVVKTERRSHGVQQAQTVTTYTGKSTTVDPPEDGSTEYDYTVRGQVTAVIQQDGEDHTIAQATYTYTPTGLLDTVEFPGGASYTNDYAYDWLGRRTTSTDVDAGVTHNTYDADGNLLTVDNPDSGYLKYIYDNLDRLTNIAPKTDSGNSAG